MKTSESIANIGKAMATFRKNVKQPEKSSVNPFFNKKYVALEGVVKSIDDALPEGLSYMQEATTTETGVAVSTIIMHSSGEYIQFDPLSVPVEKRDAQKFGSAETYARRYTLSAVFGITSDVDDDGNEATKHPNNPPRAQQAQAKPASMEDLKTVSELVTAIAKTGHKEESDIIKFYEQKSGTKFDKLNATNAKKVIKRLTTDLETLNQKDAVNA